MQKEGLHREKEALETGSGVSRGRAAAADCSSDCKSHGVPSRLGERCQWRNGAGVLFGGKACTESFVLRIFISWLQVEILRRSQGRALIEYSLLSRRVHSGSWSPCSWS